jgi:hypothetical protein
VYGFALMRAANYCNPARLRILDNFRKTVNAQAGMSDRGRRGNIVLKNENFDIYTVFFKDEDLYFLRVRKQLHGEFLADDEVPCLLESEKFMIEADGIFFRYVDDPDMVNFHCVSFFGKDYTSQWRGISAFGQQSVFFCGHTQKSAQDET